MLEVGGDQARRRQVRVLEVGEGQVKAGRLHAKTSSWMVSLEALVSSCETDCFGFVKPKLFESSSVGIFQMFNYIKSILCEICQEFSKATTVGKQTNAHTHPHTHRH